MTKQGKELIFLKQISLLGDSLIDVSVKNMSEYDEMTFNINWLSITNKILIASNFLTYIVKLK